MPRFPGLRTGILPLMNVPVRLQQAGLFFGVVVILGLAFIIGLVYTGDSSQALVRRWSKRLAPNYAQAIAARWQELLHGFAGLTRGKVVGLVIFWSLVTWACSIGMYWCVLRAFEPLARLLEAAFMVAALTGYFLPELLLPLLFWAALVGLSRVVLGVHFPFDTLMGMVLGCSVALFSLNQFVL